MARIIILAVTAIAIIGLLNCFAATPDEPNKGGGVRQESSETGLAVRGPKGKS